MIMGRKVFLSFLGTTNYSETDYVYKDEIIKKARFVQEAIISRFCKEWSSSDKIITLVTEESYKKNWLDNGHKDRKTNDVFKVKGLKTSVQNLKTKPELVVEKVPNGNDENEIWKIFDIVYNLLNEEDELVFDVTHSFRSLPMLLMVLINYAKFLKKIKVKYIFYGNFNPENPDTSDLIDITSFSLLQDWTVAANEFITFGNVRKITELTKDKIKPLLIETKGKDEVASNYRQLNVYLTTIYESILLNRGNFIYTDEYFDKLNEVINNLKVDFIKPLEPIISKILNKTEGFGSNKKILNGLEAVQWCLDFDWIQQGYTILQETIISFVINSIDLDYLNEENRNITSSCFKIVSENLPENEWKGDAGRNIELTKKILLSEWISKFAGVYNNLTQFRNDINHFGMKEQSSDANKIRLKLTEYFNAVKQIIN